MSAYQNGALGPDCSLAGGRSQAPAQLDELVGPAPRASRANHEPFEIYRVVRWNGGSEEEGKFQAHHWTDIGEVIGDESGIEEAVPVWCEEAGNRLVEMERDSNEVCCVAEKMQRRR